MSQYEELDIQLEVKDRMPYHTMLQKKLENLSKKITDSKVPFKEVQSAILDLLTDIPDSWKSEQFENELKNVTKVRKIDIRPSNANVRLSYEYCRKNNIPTVRIKREINYFALKNAIINLFDRLNLLIRKDKIEYSTGKNLVESLEDLEKVYLDDEEYDDIED